MYGLINSLWTCYSVPSPLKIIKTFLLEQGYEGTKSCRNDDTTNNSSYLFFFFLLEGSLHELVQKWWFCLSSDLVSFKLRLWKQYRCLKQGVIMPLKWLPSFWTKAGLCLRPTWSQNSDLSLFRHAYVFSTEPKGYD